MMLRFKIGTSVSPAMGKIQGLVSTERDGYIENRLVQVQYSAVRPLSHRLISQSQTFVAVKGQQSRDQLIHIARHDAIQLVDRQITSMIGHAVLREIVRANSFTAVA